MNRIIGIHSMQSCGLCCSNVALCSTCIDVNLKAHGLPIDYHSELEGLKHRNNSYGMGYDIVYSEVGKKIVELQKKHFTL